MATGYDGTINIDSHIDTKGFNQGVKSMGSQLGGLMGTLGKLGGLVTAAFAVGKLIAFAKESLTVAANYQRVALAARQVGATMGIASGEVDRIVGELKDMGIQGDVANKAFIDFARNGLDTALLPALARGAQDLNAFADTGVSSSDVMDRLMTGVIQLSPIMLRTAGVIVDTDEATRRWAAANNVAAESITIAQRQAAVLEETIRKLQATEGLYEMSQKTAAGQMSSNKRIMSDFMAALGGPFQNALYIVVLTINQMVKAFGLAIGPGGQLHGLFVSLAAIAQIVANAFRAVAEWVAGIFGITLPAIQGIATTADTAAGNLGDAAGAAEDLGDATGDAGKAAKGALAPFDELNVLQMKDTSGGGDTPPSGGGGLGTPFTPIDSGLLDEINAKMAAFAASALKFLQPVIDAFNRLVEASAPLRKTLWEGLQWLWDNILVPFGAWITTEVVPAFLDLLGAASITLNEALVALKPLGQWLWDNLLKPLAEWTGGVIISVLEGITEQITLLGDWIYNNQSAVQALGIAVGIVAIAFGIWAIATGAAAIATGLFAGVMTFLSSPVVLIVGLIILLALVIKNCIDNWDTLGPKATAAWEAIKTAFGVAWDWFKKNVVDPIAHLFYGSGLFQDIVEWALEAWEGIKEAFAAAWQWFMDTVVTPISDAFDTALLAIAGFFTTAWTNISAAWLVVTDWFQTNIVTPVHDAFDTALLAITGFFTTAWDNVKTAWEGAATWFDNTIIKPIGKFFSQMLYGSDNGTGEGGLIGWFSTAFTGIGELATTLVNTVIGFINSVFDNVGGAINGLIDSINTIIGRLSAIIPSLVGISIGKVSIPHIPEIASGAVIPPNSRFLAIMGDQRSGRNLEAPENLIRQIFREESGGGGGTIIIEFKGSMSELVRQLKPAIDKENSRVGRSLIKVGA